MGQNELQSGLARRGNVTFGVGPVHHILTNTVYVGRWRYNVRSAKTGEHKPASEIVDIETPAIIDEAQFDRVRSKLVAANPKVTPPRVTTGPILLTGLAKCAHCGGGMTQRTGTSSTGRVYAYYTCAARAQKGASVCKGNSIPMAFLDSVVLNALKQQLFTPERLSELLAALVEGRQARDAALHSRLAALKSEVLSVEDRLKRLYRSIEDGIVELDDILRDRIADLKAEREKAQATYAREAAQANPTSWAGTESIAAFSKVMGDLLEHGETPARRAYLRSLISAIVVGEKSVQIIGERDDLHAAILGRPKPPSGVRGFEPKWRAGEDSNSRPPDS